MVVVVFTLFHPLQDSCSRVGSATEGLHLFTQPFTHTEKEIAKWNSTRVWSSTGYRGSIASTEAAIFPWDVIPLLITWPEVNKGVKLQRSIYYSKTGISLKYFEWVATLFIRQNQGPKESPKISRYWKWVHHLSDCTHRKGWNCRKSCLLGFSGLVIL